MMVMMMMMLKLKLMTNDVVCLVSTEFCNMETFNATCRRAEIMLIDDARYGRMKLGRCVTRSYGHLGCAADVRHILDARCSGRRACQFIVPDPTLYSMQPCPEDFTSYLETTYSCVEGFVFCCRCQRADQCSTTVRLSFIGVKFEK